MRKYSISLFAVAALMVAGLVQSTPAPAQEAPAPTFTVVIGGDDEQRVGEGWEPWAQDLFGGGWAPNHQVTITIDHPDTEESPDVTAQSPTDASGYFNTNDDGHEPFDIKPGDQIVVTDGAHTKGHIVFDLAVTSVSEASDIVSGTTNDASSVVHVTASIGFPYGAPPPFPESADQTVTANGAGRWSARFRGLHDVRAESDGIAEQQDEDGDSTWVIWGERKPPPRDLTPTPNTYLTDGQIIDLYGWVWPPGRTLYVSECRLDVPLGPAACDAATQQAYTVPSDGTIDVQYTVTQHLSTGAGDFDCGTAPNSCGLIGVVWSGEPGVGNPSALDHPTNNVINFGAPPSTDACKNGGWQDLVDDQGQPFKNPGACLRFATRD